MKKTMYLGIIVLVLMIFGCGKATVEDVAKEHVKKQFNFNNDVKLDFSKLKYTVTEKGDNNATVNVSGTIHYQEQIFLVKDGRKWKIGEKRAEQGKQSEPPKKVEQEEHYVEQ
jgi:hypothetical protein